MYEQERPVYLKPERGWPSLFHLIGETPQSWLTGPTWRPRKWAKKEYRIIPGDEAREFLWAVTHRGRIASEIAHGKYPASVLREVAKLIGYQEDRNA